MSKMSDMAMTIEELRNAAAAINEAANWLAAQFSSDADATPVVEAKPEKKPELTLEEVRAVLAEKSRAGHTEYFPAWEPSVSRLRATLKMYFPP